MGGSSRCKKSIPPLRQIASNGGARDKSVVWPGTQVEEFSWKKARYIWRGCKWWRLWSKDFPGMRLQSGPGSRSVNRRPIGYASGCIKGANKRCAKADMDTRSNCEGKCDNGWN